MIATKSSIRLGPSAQPESVIKAMRLSPLRIQQCKLGLTNCTSSAAEWMVTQNRIGTKQKLI